MKGSLERDTDHNNNKKKIFEECLEILDEVKCSINDDRMLTGFQDYAHISV